MISHIFRSISKLNNLSDFGSRINGGLLELTVGKC